MNGVGVTEHIETERTFEVPRRWSLPRLAGTGRVARTSSPRRMTQTAAYLDTPGLDLLSAEHTLRRRTGGTDAGWHLKKPREGDSRLEMGMPLHRGPSLVPTELRAEVAVLARTRPLVPVAVLRTRRTRRELLGEAGAVLALLEDDDVEATVRVGGGRLLRWREIELELVDGDADDLEAITARLVESGLRVSDSSSKLGRALAGVEARRPAGKKKDRAGDVVLEYCADQIGVLQAGEAAVRADDPGAVHKARVATRRLRATLKTFRPLFDRTATDALRADIRRLTGALGEPRDAEVMRERILSLLDDVEPSLVRGPARSRIRTALDETHEAAHTRLVAALDSPRYERLMGDLLDLLADPPLSKRGRARAGTELPALVAAASAAVSAQAKVARRSTDPAVREEAIHEVRKKAKAARYAAEAAGDIVGSAGPAVAGAWTGLQEALGEHQDGVVAREVLDRMYRAARRAGEDTFTYGVLSGREEQKARDIEASYETLLKEARSAARTLG